MLYNRNSEHSKQKGGLINMPRFDGTGPSGKGPLTGRGLGSCNSETEVPADTRGRGLGLGRGRGQGLDRGQGLGFGRGGWRGWRR